MDPVILFFAFGLIAGILKCDLKLNNSISEFVTFILLMGIGIKGGMELHEGSLLEVLPKVMAVATLGLIIPLIAYPLLKRIGKLNRTDAASMAAHYGSVSVGTFAVCIAYLNSQNVNFEAYAPLFVIILEIPAIFIGLMIAQNKNQATNFKAQMKEVLRSRALTLLLGGLLIGWAAGAENLKSYNFLFVNLFSGVLGLFLIDMGLTVSRQYREVIQHGPFILAFGVLMPILSGSIAMAIAMASGLSMGGVVIVTILGASASYIAVPAALKVSLPEANLGLPLGSSLGVTFPFNIVFGIPLAFQAAQFFYS